MNEERKILSRKELEDLYQDKTNLLMCAIIVLIDSGIAHCNEDDDDDIELMKVSYKIYEQIEKNNILLEVLSSIALAIVGKYGISFPKKEKT